MGQDPCSGHCGLAAEGRGLTSLPRKGHSVGDKVARKSLKVWAIWAFLEVPLRDCSRNCVEKPVNFVCQGQVRHVEDRHVDCSIFSTASKAYPANALPAEGPTTSGPPAAVNCTCQGQEKHVEGRHIGYPILSKVRIEGAGNAQPAADPTTAEPQGDEAHFPMH